MQKVKANVNMCERPFLRKIIMFSLPLMASGVLQLLYNAADVIVVGQFAGHEAMAAVGSTTSLVHLFVNLFIGVSVGALSAMSHRVGAGDERRADNIVHTAIPLSVIGGVVFGVFGFFGAPWMLKLMNSPENVIGLSAKYLRIYFVGLPFLTLYNFGASILRACGDTKRPLYILAVSGLVNVALNYALVAWADMDVAGVAIGTTVSQAISAVWVIILLMKRKGYGHFSFRKMRLDKEALWHMIRIGVPAGIQGALFSISNVIIQSSINSFGDVAMAGNAAASNIEGFFYVVLNAFHQACLTFTAQNYGAKKFSNIRIVYAQCMLLATVMGVLLGTTVCLAAKPLLSLYNSNPEVIAYGKERLVFMAIVQTLSGFMDITVGAIRGLGRSFLSMVLSIGGICGLRIFWVYTVFAKHRRLSVLYWSYPITWVVTTLLQLAYMLVLWKKVSRQFQAERLPLESQVESTAD